MRGSGKDRTADSPPLESLHLEETTENEPVKLVLGFSTTWDMVEVLGHLFKCKEKSVRAQLCKKLHKFSDSDAYLAQLLSIYISNFDENPLEAYLVGKCRDSIKFCISCVCLLRALCPQFAQGEGRRPLETFLLRSIKQHKRSFSDRDRGTFDSGCRCVGEKSQLVDVFVAGESEFGRGTRNCVCSINLIRPQVGFLTHLTSLGCDQCLPHERLNVLVNQLKCINSNLPAFVCLPFLEEHMVVNICENETVILNSKPAAPFLIYLEVVFRESLSIRSCFSKSEVNLSNPVASPVRVSAASIRHRLQHRISPLTMSSSRDSTALASESWSDRTARVRAASLYGHFPGWKLCPVIIKQGDDLRQEILISQVISVLAEGWEAQKVKLWVRPVRVFVTGPLRGLIEFIPNTSSLHQIKKRGFSRLRQYFVEEFGMEYSEGYLCARENFVRSCAAYCVICYLLQVKDRHNGNILLDNEGHMMHIDYAFVMSASPGRNLGFEVSPFKLTDEFVEVMGGLESDMFRFFKSLIFQGLLTARSYVDRVTSLMEIMQIGNPSLPCFKHSTSSIQAVRQRFHLNLNEEQLQQFTETMVNSSLHSITTRMYDSYQYFSNGIF